MTNNDTHRKTRPRGSLSQVYANLATTHREGERAASAPMRVTAFQGRRTRVSLAEAYRRLGPATQSGDTT